MRAPRRDGDRGEAIVDLELAGTRGAVRVEALWKPHPAKGALSASARSL